MHCFCSLISYSFSSICISEQASRGVYLFFHYGDYGRVIRQLVTEKGNWFFDTNARVCSNHYFSCCLYACWLACSHHSMIYLGPTASRLPIVGIRRPKGPAGLIFSSPRCGKLSHLYDIIYMGSSEEPMRSAENQKHKQSSLQNSFSLVRM
jgi:hypothetical protein